MKKIWFYISILPSLMTFIGLILVYIANAFSWGVEIKVPIPILLALFFAEIIMVISGLGIVAYIKSTPKTATVKWLGIWNTLLLISACIIGYNIFMVL